MIKLPPLLPPLSLPALPPLAIEAPRIALPTISEEWFAGFVDGEGSLGIGGTPLLQPRFRLNQRDDDSPCVEAIAAWLGVGSLSRRQVLPTHKYYSENARPQRVLSVVGKDCLRVVDILERAPLRSKKAREFPIWRDAVRLYVEAPSNRWTPDVSMARDAKLRELKTQLESTREYSAIILADDEDAPRLNVRPDLYPGVLPCRVLAADWPWAFGDKTPHKGAEDHYKVMTLEEAHTFPLPPVLDDAVLFFWRVGAGNEKGSLGEAAYAVMRSWGFTPRSEVVWRKTLPCKVCKARGWAPIKHASAAIQEACAELRIWCDECKGRGHKIAIGMGRYVRGAHETCLIGARGKCFPDDKGIRSVFDGPRGEHSAKPDRFYEIVEKLYPAGPYTELFARRRRPGWQCFGDQLP